MKRQDAKAAKFYGTFRGEAAINIEPQRAQRAQRVFLRKITVAIVASVAVKNSETPRAKARGITLGQASLVQYLLLPDFGYSAE